MFLSNYCEFASSKIVAGVFFSVVCIGIFHSIGVNFRYFIAYFDCDRTAYFSYSV